jgi:hypothetical protein
MASEAPGWLRRRWMDLRWIGEMIWLGMNPPPVPRFCDAVHYADRRYRCTKLLRHDGPHRDGHFWWSERPTTGESDGE